MRKTEAGASPRSPVVDYVTALAAAIAADRDPAAVFVCVPAFVDTPAVALVGTAVRIDASAAAVRVAALAYPALAFPVGAFITVLRGSSFFASFLSGTSYWRGGCSL